MKSERFGGMRDRPPPPPPWDPVFPDDRASGRIASGGPLPASPSDGRDRADQVRARSGHGRTCGPRCSVYVPRVKKACYEATSKKNGSSKIPAVAPTPAQPSALPVTPGTCL